jgi:hypothetical protein
VVGFTRFLVGSQKTCPLLRKVVHDLSFRTTR